MAQQTVTSHSSLYRAAWRWHFIAGLIVMPVLLMMAVTGGLYLFKPELDHLIYRGYEDVPARDLPFTDASNVVNRVEQSLQGKVLQITFPSDRSSAINLMVRGKTGDALTVFADPYDGHVTGVSHYGGILRTISKIHSLQKFGFWASSVIEIVAGWCIIMVGTGIVLWWPRGKAGNMTKGGVVTVRGTPGKRVFWRDLHAVAGTFTAGIILFLAVTGMPWSMFWGDHVQSWLTAAHLYEPPAPAKVTPGWMLAMDMPGMSADTAQATASDKSSPARGTADMDMSKAGMSNMDMSGMKMPGNAAASSSSSSSSGSGASTITTPSIKPDPHPDLPWALQKTTPPKSQPDAGAQAIGLDAAIAQFDTLGIPHPYSVALPQGADGAYMADYRPDHVENSRTVYLDQYSGKVIGDVGFAQWGAGAKAVEWGINVHEGLEYGPLNRLVMLTGCLAILLLAVSGLVMWWKRRPVGRLGVPPMPRDARIVRSVFAVIAVVGVIFPLVGLSLIMALAVDMIIAKSTMPRRMRA